MPVTPRTFTATPRSNPSAARTVVSDLTEQEAAEILRHNGCGFCATLVEVVDSWREPDPRRRRSLSQSQLSWLHVRAVEQRDKAKEAAASAELLTDDEVKVERIVSMLRKMAAHVKEPRIRLVLERKDIHLKLVPDGAPDAGTVNVTAPWGRIGLGRIMGDGIFLPTVRAEEYPGLADLLRGFADDPVGVARKYGQDTGNCCFCRLALTDDRSVAAGFGPRCARHAGLYEEWKSAAKALAAAVGSKEEVPA